MGGVHWLKSKSEWRTFLPAHEPSFGARPVPGRSGSDSLLVPEPSPSRRLHSDPLRAGTSRAPDAGGFRGARRNKSSGRSLLGDRERVRASVSPVPFFGVGSSDRKLNLLPSPVTRLLPSHVFHSDLLAGHESTRTEFCRICDKNW